MRRSSPSKQDRGAMALLTAAASADSGAESGVERIGRYRLVASAIAGRTVEVAPAGAGEPAWTDGVTIFIAADADPSRQLEMIAVQSSLLGAGSLDKDLLGPLSRRPALARRYLAVEGHRALGRHEQLLPTSVRPVINPVMARRTTSPVESLAIAGGREPLDEAPETFGIIQPRRVEASAVASGDRDAVHQHTPRRVDQAQLRELVGDDEDDDRPAVDILSSPVGGGGGIGRLLKKLFGDARSKGDGPPGADAPTRWTRRGHPVARTPAFSTTTAPLPEGTGDVQRSGITYPEWDRNRRRYKLDWCTVEEIDPPMSDLAPLRPADTHGLRRALGRLGMEFQRHHRQLQGDDIDIDAAVEAHVEMRAGSVPDEAVYIDTLRRRRDVSVLLLLDVSGSAGERSATGVPVHEHQRSAAGALAVALHGLGDRVALYGFRSQGRSAVHILPIMRFGDGPDALVMQRLGGLVPGAYTRLGAAIRHGAAVLEQDAGTARRLLVVLSDGFAYDHGYERSYGEADARRALAEARRRGIGCLCLSIGAATDVDALRRVFGTAAHAAIPRVELLPTVVGPLFRAALRSAELQRRVFQRRERTRERLGVERRTA
jgi:nitric oxide reductase NorD protein